MLEYIDELGGPQHHNHYPTGWAQAGNTPLKRYKQNTHGGGIRDPMIVHWPARIKDGGAVRSQYHHVSDVTPTVLEAIGIEAPAVYNGVEQMPVEGTSFAYTFGAADEPTHKETQYYEMLGHRAIWHDGWKASRSIRRAATSTTTAGSYTTSTTTSPNRATWRTSTPSACASWSTSGGTRHASTTSSRSPIS